MQSEPGNAHRLSCGRLPSTLCRVRIWNARTRVYRAPEEEEKRGITGLFLNSIARSRLLDVCPLMQRVQNAIAMISRLRDGEFLRVESESMRADGNFNCVSEVCVFVRGVIWNRPSERCIVVNWACMRDRWKRVKEVDVVRKEMLVKLSKSFRLWYLVMHVVYSLL